MNIFEFRDYKIYLRERLPTTGIQRGSRAKLAELLDCQGGFVSQVLHGKVHFSMDQIAKIDRFLEHSPEETDIFLTLVSLSRANSDEVRGMYRAQLNRLLARRRRVDARIAETSDVGSVIKAEYYSSWVYSAVHVLIMVPNFQNLTKLAATLGLSHTRLQNILAALKRWGLVTEHAGKWSALPSRWHLSRESPAFVQHHTNWRLQAIRGLELQNVESLHYSGPMAITKAASKAIHTLLLEAITSMEPHIAAPGEEVGRVVCIDYFALGDDC